MITIDWMFRAALVALLAGGCAPGDHEEVSTSEREPPAALQRNQPQARRPEGWDAASHAERPDPDFGRVFPDHRVQRIDIEMTPEIQTGMWDDLRQRIGGGGGPSAAVKACQGLARGAACTFLELRGTCAPQGFMNGGASGANAPLACREADASGALDMIPGDPIVVPVTVRFDGQVWNHVGMRFKGNSSLNGPWRTGGRKLGLRLDFDKFEGEHPETKNQRFYGFSKLVFASAYSDTSLIREKLAADLLRQSGLRAAHASFYRVYVRAGGEEAYWGLYTVLEDPADVLPRTQFTDGSGNLYKPDGVGANFQRFDKRGFEKKSNEKAADFSDVERAVTALHAPRADAETWRRNLEAVFDVDTFLGNLATGRAMDHFDSYGTFPHNYYVYGDPSQQGRLVWISWDHNLTWGGMGNFARSSVMMDEAGQSWPLIRYLLDDPTYRARYRAWLFKLLEGSYEKTRFDAHATALHALIAPYVIGEHGERAPYTNLRSPQNFTNGLTSLLATGDKTRNAIRAALAKEDAAEAAKNAAAAPAIPAEATLPANAPPTPIARAAAAAPAVDATPSATTEDHAEAVAVAARIMSSPSAAAGETSRP